MGKIIFVHGIGDLKPDYWHEWRDRVADATGTNNLIATMIILVFDGKALWTTIPGVLNLVNDH